MKNSLYARLVHEELNNINSEAVYISKSENFAHEYDLLLNSFKKFYDHVNIAYSFKTNYIPDFLKIIKNKEGYAEVVSIMELELALKVGFNYKNIFFNGPFKHEKETLEFLSKGGLVNVDSYDEFELIENFSKKSRIKCRIGIRLNFEFKENHSRFGISVNDDSIKKIFSKCINSDFLSIESLHYHYAPRQIDVWKSCSNKFITFLNSLSPEIIKNIRYISLGGGMFSRMDSFLKKQLPFKIPSFDDYAKSSIKLIASYFDTKTCFSHKPEILIEPGTALASKSLDFAVRVISLKKLNNKIYINTSGSKYNMNPSLNRINSPVVIHNCNPKNTVSVNNANICGYTCIESDIIHNDFSGKVAKGDTIIFREIGSYSVVMKPPFILPDVAIIEFDYDLNNFKLIREKQSSRDVFHTFKNIKYD